jgi:hypothetical protein
MNSCWNINIDDRPTFVDLHKNIKQLLVDKIEVTSVEIWI